MRLLALALVACHTDAHVTPCARVVDHFRPAFERVVEPIAGQLLDLVAQHCAADAWSTEATSCLATVAEPDADRCGKFLSEAQIDATTTALYAVWAVRPRAAPLSCAAAADRQLALGATAGADSLTYYYRFVGSCHQAAWSEAARRCLLEARTLDDTERCAALLTDAQRDEFKRRQAQ